MFVGTVLEKYQRLAQEQAVHDFAQNHGGLYLLGHVPKGSPEGDLDFYTGVINISDTADAKAASEKSSRASISPGDFLVKIVKKQSNVWSSWLSIGRTNNNDIVIRHPSVSKFHARLDTQGPVNGLSGDKKSLWITDNDSSKGTKTNGNPLSPGVRYLLQLEDIITFGEVEMVLFDAARLHHQLTLM